MNHRLSRWVRRSNWFAVSTVPGVVLVGVGTAYLMRSPDAPPVGEQIAADALVGSRVSMLKRARLRSAAERSHLVVLHRLHSERGVAGSDELRIYDREDDQVNRSLVLRPARSQPNPPTVAAHGITWGNQTPRTFRFALSAIKDFDGDGRAELVGSFRSQTGTIEYPVSVAWSDARERYVVSALIPSKPTAPVYDTGALPIGGPAHWARREARTPLKIAVWPDAKLVTLYGTATSAITRLRRTGLLFVTGFPALTTSRPTSVSSKGVSRHRAKYRWFTGRAPGIGKITVAASRLRFIDGRAQLRPCPVYGSSRVGPNLVIPRLVVSALPISPLNPRRIHLDKHVAC